MPASSRGLLGDDRQGLRRDEQQTAVLGLGDLVRLAHTLGPAHVHGAVEHAAARPESSSFRGRSRNIPTSIQHWMIVPLRIDVLGSAALVDCL